MVVSLGIFYDHPVTILFDYLVSRHLPDIQETRLRQFCSRFWGRGDEGRREIYETQDTIVPCLDDGRDDEVPFDAIDEGELEDVADDESGGGSGTGEGDLIVRPSNTSAAATSTVSYTTLSLGPGFDDFFGPGRDKILVRDEYRAMLDHIETIQAKGSGGGAVVIGQPGIGKELSQFLERP
jgi:hypothetical protein